MLVYQNENILMCIIDKNNKKSSKFILMIARLPSV